MSNNSTSNGGLSLTATLFIVFLILKLTDNIDWSWWWVTSPLWIPLAGAVCLIALILVFIIIALIFGMSVDDIKLRGDALKKTFKKD